MGIQNNSFIGRVTQAVTNFKQNIGESLAKLTGIRKTEITSTDTPVAKSNQKEGNEQQVKGDKKLNDTANLATIGRVLQESPGLKNTITLYNKVISENSVLNEEHLGKLGDNATLGEIKTAIRTLDNEIGERIRNASNSNYNGATFGGEALSSQKVLDKLIEAQSALQGVRIALDKA